MVCQTPLWHIAITFAELFRYHISYRPIFYLIDIGRYNCLKICTDTDFKEKRKKRKKKNEELEQGWIVNSKDFFTLKKSLPQLTFDLQ